MIRCETESAKVDLESLNFYLIKGNEMAAATITFYNSFKESIADGTMDMDDTTADTFKLALFNSSYSPAASDTTYSALSNELATALGYTSAGASLTSVTYAQTAGTATFNAADVAWTASGGSIVCRTAVLYDASVGGANDLILWVSLDPGSDVTTTDGNVLTVQWNVSGIFTLV